MILIYKRLSNQYWSNRYNRMMECLSLTMPNTAIGHVPPWAPVASALCAAGGAALALLLDAIWPLAIRRRPPCGSGGRRALAGGLPAVISRPDSCS
jgi:hypothetical protein